VWFVARSGVVSEQYVHDSLVYAVLVECERRIVTLFTAYPHWEPTELTDVVFTGVLAHHFRHVLEGNILDEIVAVEVNAFVGEHAGDFDRASKWGWPPDYTAADAFRESLRVGGFQPYEISSSYGMSGWVIARSLRYLPRSARYRGPQDGGTRGEG